jgi:hypothetical protein
VADLVMRGDSTVATVADAGSPRLSRKCAACEEEAAAVRMTPAPAAGKSADHAPAIVHDVLRSSGRLLDSAARAFFEPRFGYDFDRVRVHSGSEAAASARAFTVGDHVVFGAGEYAAG